MTEITLRTRAWMGDEEGTFTVPDGWDVSVYGPKDAETIDDEAVRKALTSPIGTERLSELARGRKSAVIILDDLSRPTPAANVAPFVLAELREAGVPDSGIRFVIGGGAHRPLTQEEMAKKVGREIAGKYEVFNHDAYSGDLVGLGNLDDGTPVYVNPVVAESEVKIGLSGIYPHPSAGLGGGAKIVLPGIVGITTIAYNHMLFSSRGRGNVERQTQDVDMRDNLERVARFVGLDIIVNTVLNSKREVAGLFVGDVVKAHRAGCAFAKQVYGTSIPKSALTDTDIVFINAYPLDYDPVQVGKSTWPTTVFENAYKVVVNAASDGVLYHGLSDRMDYARYLMLKQKGSNVKVPARASVTSKEQMIMLSEHFAPKDFYGRYEDGALFDSRDALVEELKKVCPNGKVAVIPCSAIQLPEIV